MSGEADDFLAVLLLDTLVRLLCDEPGFSALTCSGALFSALGNAERYIERRIESDRAGRGVSPTEGAPK